MRSHRSHPARRFAVFAMVFTLTMWSGLSMTNTPAGAVSNWTFVGKGWGHGIGMSQYGARGMAARGSTATQILTHYFQGSSVQTASVINDLRILVAEKANTLTVAPSGSTTFGGVGAVGNGSSVSITRSGDSIKLTGSLSATVASPLDLTYTSPVRVTPPGARYAHGSVRIAIDPAGGLRVIVRNLTMDKYLRGLGEMPSLWPAEALKAQAIAGRSFAQNIVGAANRSAKDFDLYNGVIHQTYIGYEKEDPSKGGAPWVAAVNATSGKAVTYGGSVIATYYSSSSGGHTENSENVWVAVLPFLRGVPDPGDLYPEANNPNASWSVSFTPSALGAKLGIGSVTAVDIGAGGRGVSGRLDKANIKFSSASGSVTKTGAQLRSLLGLKSTLFTIPGATGSLGTMVTGQYQTAMVQGRKIVIGGKVTDPDGTPEVEIRSVFKGVTTTRRSRSVNGKFLDAWTAQVGTHKVCVSAIDTPTSTSVHLGCRNVTVK